MANDLTKSIKYIDTAAAIFAEAVPLGKIVWSNTNAAGDILLLKDAAGVILYSVKAGIQYDYFEFDFNGAPHSLTVTTIGSGVLMVHPYLP
jgi:hypothetical protein